MKISTTVRPKFVARFVKSFWNIISVNIGWMACILSAARGQYWLGLAAVMVFFVIHITAVDRHNIHVVFLVTLVTITVGFLTDTALIAIGTLEPNRWVMPTPFTTIWDLVIWANFSLVLNTSLQILQKRLFTAAVLGAVFAPWTYYAGDRLGALNLSKPISISLLWIGLLWFFVMPLLSLMAKHFYGSSRKPFV